MALLRTIVSLVVLNSLSGYTLAENGGTSYEDLPDCKCKNTWTHNEYKCNASNPMSTSGPTVMTDCPSLNILSKCEDQPVQSWCETEQTNCKQQVGSPMEGKGWAHCNPRTQQPELPLCVCASTWFLNQGSCATQPLKVQGCPSSTTFAYCNETIGFKQPWCRTTQARCLEQEDDPTTTSKMVGESWSFCDPFEQTAELPACECRSSWKSTHACTGEFADQVFHGCADKTEMAHCNSTNIVDPSQSWCKTTRHRCREQTYSTSSSMINHSWAVCNPETNQTELPVCDCKETWSNTEYKCSIYNMKMSGCPSLADTRRCDNNAEQPHCETVYNDCKEQNYESAGQGWSYCDTDTNKGEYGVCECQDTWFDTQGDCGNKSGGVKMRGCPTLDDLQVCQSAEKFSWCPTKSKSCKGQENSGNEAWVVCDPQTQEAILIHADHGTIIAVSSFLTFLVMAIVVLVGVILFRRWLKKNTIAYEQLYGDSDDVVLNKHGYVGMSGK